MRRSHSADGSAAGAPASFLSSSAVRGSMALRALVNSAAALPMAVRWARTVAARGPVSRFASSIAYATSACLASANTVTMAHSSCSDQCGKDARSASKIALSRLSMAGLASNRVLGRQSVAGGAFLAIDRRRAHRLVIPRADYIVFSHRCRRGRSSIRPSLDSPTSQARISSVHRLKAVSTLVEVVVLVVDRQQAAQRMVQAALGDDHRYSQSSKMAACS